MDVTKMLRTGQTAKALDVSEARIRQMVADGTLQGAVVRTPLGNLYDPAAVADLAAQRAERKSGAPAEAGA